MPHREGQTITRPFPAPRRGARQADPAPGLLFSPWNSALAAAPVSDDRMGEMKLAQNQVWKQGDGYIRLVQLERLVVQYKAVTNLLTGEGTHHQVSKKEFCRLIKSGTLLTHEEVREIWKNSPGSEEAAAAEPRDGV